MYVVGEKNLVLMCHEVDEAGPDADVLQEMGAPNALSVCKTKCGEHYGSDPVESAMEHLPLCPDCQ